MGEMLTDAIWLLGTVSVIHMLFADRFKVQLLTTAPYNKMLYFETFFNLPEASTEARALDVTLKGSKCNVKAQGSSAAALLLF